jgi:O-antigen ligase
MPDLILGITYALLILAPFLPVGIRLSVTALLSTLMLYGLTPIPYGVAWLIVAGIPPLLSRARLPRRTAKVIALLAAIATLQAVAWVYSPDVVQGLGETAATLAVAAAVLLTSEALRSNPAAVRQALLVLAASASINALLVAAFRIDAELEIAYLTWGPAGYFSGADVWQIFASRPNNVLYATKAGGLFLNGNTASMFHGATALFIAAAAVRYKSLLLAGLAAVNYAGVFFTGSKTGIALAVTIPLAIFALILIYRYPARGLGLLILSLVVPIFAGLRRLVSTYAPAYIEDSSTTLDVRQRIWQVALDAFTDSPVFGYGFGGWEAELTKKSSAIGVPGYFPTHNFLLQAWSDYGLLGAGITLTLAVLGVVWCLRDAKAAQEPWTAVSNLLLAGALVWISVHGLGDNTRVFGENHTIFLFGCALAVSGSSALAQQRRTLTGGEVSGGSPIRAGSEAPHASPKITDSPVGSRVLSPPDRQQVGRRRTTMRPGFEYELPRPQRSGDSAASDPNT